MTDDESEPTEGERPPGTEALVAYLEARYGDRFDDDRRGRLADAVAEVREESEAVRAEPLDNAEGPAFAFEPHRGGSE